MSDEAVKGIVIEVNRPIREKRVTKHNSGTSTYLTTAKAGITASRSKTNEPKKEDNQDLTQVHELSEAFYVSYP